MSSSSSTRENSTPVFIPSFAPALSRFYSSGSLITRGSASSLILRATKALLYIQASQSNKHYFQGGFQRSKLCCLSGIDKWVDNYPTFHPVLPSTQFNRHSPKGQSGCIDTVLVSQDNESAIMRWLLANRSSRFCCAHQFSVSGVFLELTLTQDAQDQMAGLHG